jgi:integrase/recombinase XerD
MPESSTIRDCVRRQNAVTLNYQQGHLHRKSETLSERGVYRVALRYGWQADAPAIRLHNPRRTFAKLARDGEAPLEQIQLSLGHESVVTTERYLGSKLNYQDDDDDRLRLNVRV